MRIPLPEGLKRRVKATLGLLRARRRVAELERTEPHVSQADLVAGLRGLGVVPGDVLFVHSSLRSLGFVSGGPDTVIAALQEAVGPEGTVLLPTYYLPGGTITATCEMPDYTFDKRVHGTNMGALPAALLATPSVRRSIHPTHSVGAIGAQADWLTNAHHLAPSVFGEGSPWKRFSELPQAKVLGLGITMGPVTFYHLLEDAMGDAFPVRVWNKQYSMPCVAPDRAICHVPVLGYDPEVVARRIDAKHRGDLQAWFAAEFEAAGLKRNGRVGQAVAWVIPAASFLEYLRKLALEGITVYSATTDGAIRPPGQVALGG